MMCHSDIFDKGIKVGTGHYEEHMCNYFEFDISVQRVSFEDFSISSSGVPLRQ